MSKTMDRDAKLAQDGIDGLTGDGADDGVIYIPPEERLALQRGVTSAWRHLMDRLSAEYDPELDAPVPIEVGANLKASKPGGLH